MDVWKRWLRKFFSRRPAVTETQDERLCEAHAILLEYGENADWSQLSQHYNGYVRELAIRRLSAYPGIE
jgi:hypothetical protein